jgi:hypothetical protein
MEASGVKDRRFDNSGNFQLLGRGDLGHQFEHPKALFEGEHLAFAGRRTDNIACQSNLIEAADVVKDFGRIECVFRE